MRLRKLNILLALLTITTSSPYLCRAIGVSSPALAQSSQNTQRDALVEVQALQESLNSVYAILNRANRAEAFQRIQQGNSFLSQGQYEAALDQYRQMVEITEQLTRASITASQASSEETEDEIPPSLRPTSALPRIPSLPSIPDIPSIPRTPSVPGIPGSSKNPFPKSPAFRFPDVPAIPGIPPIPGIPTMPGIPGIPSIPGRGSNPFPDRSFPQAPFPNGGQPFPFPNGGANPFPTSGDPSDNGSLNLGSAEILDRPSSSTTETISIGAGIQVQSQGASSQSVITSNSNSQAGQTLYTLGSAYYKLAQTAEKLGFSSQVGRSLAGAERTLIAAAKEMGVFSFAETPGSSTTTTSSSSTPNSSTFNIFVREVGPTQRSEVKFNSNYALAALTLRLLQRVYLDQGLSDRALLVAESTRTIEVDSNIAYNLFNSFNNRSDKLQALAKDLSSVPTLDEIQAVAKRENATIVSYSILSQEDFNDGNASPGQLLIWVIKPSGEVKFQPINLSDQLKGFQGLDQASLNDLDRGKVVRVLNDGMRDARETLGISNLDSAAGVRQVNEAKQHEQLQQLYQLLIAPIANLLPKDPNQHVVFVPHGPLFFVPFAALEPKPGQYLIDQHTIRTAPNLRTLILNHRTRRQPDRNQKIVLVGNPTMPTVKLSANGRPQQLLPLPKAGEEAAKIAQLFQNLQQQVKLFPPGQSARKQEVVRQMRDAQIIHLATHGILNDSSTQEPDTQLSDNDPELQRILQGLDPKLQQQLRQQFQKFRQTLTQQDQFSVRQVAGAIALSPSDQDDGLLTALELLELDLKADLVVLSACNTGRGPLTAGGVIGLPLSLSLAGVPKIIVSLWAVPDAPTQELMTAFYRQLLSSSSQRDEARALRQAMLTIKQDHPNPRDWAAFTFIGSPD